MSTNDVSTKTKGYVSMTDPEYSICSDCGSCELVCSLAHEGACGPTLRRIWLDRDPYRSYFEAVSCKQCDPAPCMAACKFDAMYRDEETGAVIIDDEKCKGCKACIRACMFDIKRIGFDPERKKAVKCDLCKDRPDGPQCVKYCSNLCLEVREK